MTGEHLTAILAQRVMGWDVGPERFQTGGRSWRSRWRFQPLTRLEDAFELLDHAKSDYKLANDGSGTFTAEVQVRGRTGKASGQRKARTITLALAQALGLEVPQE
jgi:hypothetical protein